MKTGIAWLDEIVEQANLPKLTDREGAALIYGKLVSKYVSPHTLRQMPIPYRLVGRSASYQVDDIVAYARRRLAEAPIRKASDRSRRKRAEAAATNAKRPPRHGGRPRSACDPLSVTDSSHVATDGGTRQSNYGPHRGPE